jgi:hypothetical protein
MGSEMSKVLEVGSIGAGVQSSNMVMRSIHGEFPKLDYGIFADTGYESKATYRFLYNFLIPQMQDAGITMLVVKKDDDLLESAFRHHGFTGIHANQGSQVPVFVSSEKGIGISIRRSCTYDYKVKIIEKAEREILGLKKGQRWPLELKIRNWMGISYDEIQRMKVSQRPAVEFYYPLVEERLTRGHCLEWMEKHGYPRPPRSACVFCAFRSNDYWRELRDTDKDGWDLAVNFDKRLRTDKGENSTWKGELYLHRDGPLDEILFESDGQLSLLDECEGMCGV